MSKPLDEKRVRELIEEEVEKKIAKYQPKEPLTKEEFLKALELIEKRFDKADERFEAIQQQMDKRFEAIQQQMDKRFEAMQQQMDKRFGEVDKRFEELITLMNKQFEETNKRFEKLFEGQLLLKVAIDSLGQRSGVRLEKTILKLMQKVLEKRDMDINKVEWIELMDEKGEVFTKNYRTDIDVLIRNGLHFLMEVKYRADNRDIYHFLRVAELYTKKYRKPNKLLLLTLEIDQRHLEYAERENIEVITGDFD